MPKFPTGGSTSGFNPGDILTIAKSTGLVGISLMDAQGTWPTDAQTGTLACPEGSGVTFFPDHDGDDKPGITLRMGRIGQTFQTTELCGGFQSAFTFRGAPLDAVQALLPDSVRAVEVHAGVRTILGGGGAIGDDCASGVGVSQAEALDSRVWGCVKSDGSTCNETTEAPFVDSSAPQYNILAKDTAPPTSVLKPACQCPGDCLNPCPLDQTPSPGPRSALVRLGGLDGAFTCADVRNATFPAL
jgi:hypothetical protein